jgi:hypothetical protein
MACGGGAKPPRRRLRRAGARGRPDSHAAMSSFARSLPRRSTSTRRLGRRRRALRRSCSPQLMPTRQVRGAAGRGPSVERDHWRARERQRSENPAFSLESAGPEAAPRSEFALQRQPSARQAALEHLATCISPPPTSYWSKSKAFQFHNTLRRSYSEARGLNSKQGEKMGPEPGPF